MYTGAPTLGHMDRYTWHTKTDTRSQGHRHTWIYTPMVTHTHSDTDGHVDSRADTDRHTDMDSALSGTGSLKGRAGLLEVSPPARLSRCPRAVGYKCPRHPPAEPRAAGAA